MHSNYSALQFASSGPPPGSVSLGFAARSAEALLTLPHLEHQLCERAWRLLPTTVSAVPAALNWWQRMVNKGPRFSKNTAEGAKARSDGNTEVVPGA